MVALARRSLITASCIALLAIATPAPAQHTTYAVSGAVFDSTTNTALTGAIVHVVQLDSASRFTNKGWWGVADARGRFKIAGLPVGRFAIGFQHETLAALGIESPLRIIELTANATVDLAIAPGSVGGAQRCTGHVAAGTGTLTGYILDAVTGAPPDSVVLDIRWIEVPRGVRTYGTVPHRLTAAVSADGKYAACGLPAGRSVTVRITRSGYRDVSGAITIAEGSARRRDFHLARAHAGRGAGILAGRVLRDDSVPVGSGRVLIPALNVDVPIAEGRFTLSGLPAGTWTAEARAIGYEPESEMIDVVADGASSATIVLGPKVQPLEPVTVIARSPVEMRRLAEIMERQRVGFGTIFMPGDERLANAKSLSDLARVAPGFRIGKGHSIEGRIIGKYSTGLKRCVPTLYINGIRSDTLGFPMEDVLAVAMYPDLMGVPVQYHDLRNCGAILVWMKKF